MTPLRKDAFRLDKGFTKGDLVALFNILRNIINFWHARKRKLA